MTVRGAGPEVARRLVAEWFPQARTAWVGGSVARGDETSNSDLDVTVLLEGPPAPC
ncbi:MAG: nucleotidyltransferase domain-containing protein [Pseudonocardiaceae bacterium]